ncbi:MAG: hypothetical protein M3345_00645, partial [Actinomycetota bacterium]|nr:hypothetical protein [Actinomycetota bacterium]
MRTLRVATAASEPELEAAVASTLLARGDLEVVLRCVDRVELLALARGGAVDAILLAGVPEWVDPQCFEECTT